MTFFLVDKYRRTFFKLHKLNSPLDTERAFCQKYPPSPPRFVQYIRAFHQLIDTLKKTEQSCIYRLFGEDLQPIFVEIFFQFFEILPKAYEKSPVTDFEITWRRVWKISKQNFKWKSRKTYTIQAFRPKKKLECKRVSSGAYCHKIDVRVNLARSKACSVEAGWGDKAAPERLERFVVDNVRRNDAAVRKITAQGGRGEVLRVQPVLIPRPYMDVVQLT